MIDKRLIVFVIVFSSLLLFSYTFIKSSSPSEKFKVVDRYKNCNVIRYTDPSNRYQYFLRCSL